MPWDDSGDYIRSGHNSPDNYSTCRTIDVSAEQGIKATYCQRKDDPAKWEIQSYLFDKKKWDMDRAKAWFDAHMKKGEMAKMETAQTKETVTAIEKMHPDFEKILAQFIKRYGPEGKEKYHAWLIAMGLNDSKPYSSQTEGKEKTAEKFSWAAPILDASKADEKYSYWKIEAAFPLTSMNGNLYTEDELKAASRTLIGKEVNMNHEPPPFPAEEVSIVDAEYEDGATECIVKVKHGSELEKKLKNQEVISVSIQGGCRNRKEEADGLKCEGMLFSGLAFLDKGKLPGIPLTRIMSAEAIAESMPSSSKANETPKEKHEEEKPKEKIETEEKKAESQIPETSPVSEAEKESPPASPNAPEKAQEKVENVKEKLQAEASNESAKANVEAKAEVEECECILKNLPNSYYERQRQYHKDGLSLKDSWRKATQELLTALDKKAKKDAKEKLEKEKAGNK